VRPREGARGAAAAAAAVRGAPLRAAVAARDEHERHAFRSGALDRRQALVAPAGALVPCVGGAAKRRVQPPPVEPRAQPPQKVPFERPIGLALLLGDPQRRLETRHLAQKPALDCRALALLRLESASRVAQLSAYFVVVAAAAVVGGVVEAL
jgi:hypothetical protein